MGQEEMSVAFYFAPAPPDHFCAPVQRIGSVIINVLKTPLLTVITEFLVDWLGLLKGEARARAYSEMVLLPLFNTAVSNVLLFLCNLLTYTHEFSTKLRKHIAMGSALMQDVVFPYMELTLGMLEQQRGDEAVQNALTTTVIHMAEMLGLAPSLIMSPSQSLAPRTVCWGNYGGGLIPKGHKGKINTPGQVQALTSTCRCRRTRLCFSGVIV